MQNKNMLQEKIEHFFQTHPKENVVYSALGVLFTDKEKATKYLAGVAGRSITIHTREGITHEKISDEIFYKIAEQENKVNGLEIAYHQATPTSKEKAMSDWKFAQELLAKMKRDLDKQIRLEEKEEQIARAEKESPATRKPLTEEDYQVKMEAQKKMIEATEKILANPKLKAAKKKDAEKVLSRQQKALKDLEAKLAELNAPAEVAEDSNIEDAGATDQVENTEIQQPLADQADKTEGEPPVVVEKTTAVPVVEEVEMETKQEGEKAVNKKPSSNKNNKAKASPNNTKQ
jgi:hypothetical protein